MNDVGRSLLNYCKQFQIHMLNSRSPHDQSGEYTFCSLATSPVSAPQLAKSHSCHCTIRPICALINFYFLLIRWQLFNNLCGQSVVEWLYPCVIQFVWQNNKFQYWNKRRIWSFSNQLLFVAFLPSSCERCGSIGLSLPTNSCAFFPGLPGYDRNN